MSYRFNMSAGEARAEGLEVPDTVPDCATLKIDPRSLEVGESRVSEDDSTMVIATMKAKGRWTHHVITITLDTTVDVDGPDS